MQIAKDEQNIIRWLELTNNMTHTYLDKRYEHLGISGFQHIYVTVVYRNPGIPQNELLKFSWVNPSNVTRNLTYLEESGYLKRVRDEKDKRAWRLYPAEKAYENYEEIVRIFNNWQKDILGDFTEEERDNLVNYLKRMANKLREKKDNI